MVVRGDLGVQSGDLFGDLGELTIDGGDFLAVGVKSSPQAGLRLGRRLGAHGFRRQPLQREPAGAEPGRPPDPGRGPGVAGTAAAGSAQLPPGPAGRAALTAAAEPDDDLGRVGLAEVRHVRPEPDVQPAQPQRDDRDRDGDRYRGNGWNRNQGWNGSRYSYNNDYRRWDNRWRSNNRYDWYSYRRGHGDVYRLGGYYAPYRGYSYRRLSIGFFLDSLFFSQNYWINDPWQYRLPDVYGPYRWVRYYDDALLVNTYTGEVVDVIYDFFW